MSNQRRVWILDFARTGAVPTSRKEIINGIEFNVELSPFGVPMQISVAFDESQRRMVITFEYPTHEAERLVCDHEDPHSVIYVGEDSSRVQRIEVNVDDHEGKPVFDRVKLNLMAAADHVEYERENAPEWIRDNYSVVAQSLRSEALLEPLSSD